MRLVTLVAQPDRLDDVVAAAVRAGATGLTATEVRGFGQQFGHLGEVNHAEVAALVLPKLRVEVLVADDLAWPLAEALAKSVNTGTIGDGKIWISPVDTALRVRTGDRDEAAL